MELLKTDESVLNHILVELFNEILKTEEQCISCGDFKNITLKEIHLIEAVCNAEENQSDNSATSIANALKITPGSLTTAVKLLEKKGYLLRKKDSRDKRIVRIISTESGRSVNIIHKEFHKEMVEETLHNLSDGEKEVLIKALESVGAFFEKKYKWIGEIYD